MYVFVRGLLCMGLLFVFHTGIAQTIVKGKVIDNMTGEPLENAVISAGGKGRSVLTDEQGNFEIEVAVSVDSIRASFVGYRRQSQEIDRGDESCLFRLSRSTVDMRSITVQPMPNNALFSVVSHIDVNLHALNSAQDLMRLVPGLSLMQHQGGGIADHIFFRGFDADHGTDVGVSVDGMPLN